MKEEIKFIEVKVTQLDTSKTYIFQVEVDGMPKEQVIRYITRLSDMLINLGFQKDKFIIVPTCNGLNTFDIKEVTTHD